MEYLKGKFCLEYAQTLKEVGKNVEVRRLLEKGKDLLNSVESLSQEETIAKQKYLSDIDELLSEYLEEDNYIFQEEEETEETKILKNSSKIGDVTVNPFSEYELYNIRFDTDEDYFTDSCDFNIIQDLVGKGIWRRPQEFFSEVPEVVKDFLAPSIKQQEMGDCGNIASVMSIANHMALYGTKYLKEMIYPQNKDGEPIYNPFGKYVIKLYINGCFRFVVVDDYLLANKDNTDVIIAHSLLQTELWVSLLEKAILKVFYTGYYFNYELSCYTGCAAKEYSQEKLKNGLNEIWKEVYSFYSEGQIISTLSIADKKELDVITFHTYSILAVYLSLLKHMFNLF